MMTAEPGTDRLRDAFVADAGLLGEGESCPPAEKLWESARGELSRDRNDEVILHLGECGACAAAWRLARELSGVALRAGAPALESDPARPGWRPWLAIAATLALAAALSVQLFHPWREAEPAYRTQESSWLLPAGEDGERLPRESFLLRWTPGPEGCTYDVRLTTEELDLLARARRLERAEYRVAPEALRGVPEGTRLFWQVTARLPDGRRIDSTAYAVVVE